MVAAQNGNAQVGNSIDRFLIRAIIALAFLMIGVVLGFGLAVFWPATPAEPSQPAMAKATEPEAEPAAPGAETQVVETPPEQPEAVVAEPVAEPVDEPADDGEADAAVEPKPEPEPTPGVEPPPMSGNLIVEIRDVTAETRSKADIRAVVKQHGHEFEACIAAHGPGLEQARTHYQVYVTPNGKVAGSLLLQGISPELDACVEKAIETWNFQVAGDNSFFKIKLIWTA
jgi:hypothetical protein